MAEISERRLPMIAGRRWSCLDALALPDGEVRLTFGTAGDEPPAIALEGDLSGLAWTPLVGARVARARSEGGAIRVIGGGAPKALRATPPDLSLLHGCRAMVAFWTGEPAEQIRDWLLWHRETQGLDAALIVDRMPPEAEALAPRLRQTLADDLPGLALVVVRPDLPLGREGQGPETDAYFAPDAPGRDRMTPPPADPWRAPLGEVAILEVLRHRFLAGARAVANLDLSDLLEAPSQGAPSVFERAEAAPGGILPLAGRHAYPWRVPPGEVARFADHGCTPFDRSDRRWRWCVAPARTGEAVTWRLLKVAGAAGDRASAATFWRCMALRHPGQPVSAIVPKASLVPDKSLVALMKSAFGRRPELPPPVRPRRPGPVAGVTLVTSMKNEGPFAIDWIAWHKAMGAARFLIYSNDCTDGTEELLVRLAEHGEIVHRNNDGYRATGLTPQHSVLAAADADPVTAEADWLAFIDVDEYINVKTGDGRFADLFEAMPGANMISMTWRLFGNADVHAFEDRPVVDVFDRCAPEFVRKPHQAWGFKTLFRNLGLFKKLGVHRPKGLNPQLIDEIAWVNGSGRPMPREIYRNGWRSTQSTYGYDIVQLNHYAVRSAESFLVKRDRGRANHVDRDQGLTYWFRMNNNAQKSLDRLPVTAAFRAERARLMALQGVAERHAEAVRRHRAKIGKLRATPAGAAFYATLTSARMERLSRLLQHFGANVFQQGPDVVPDDFVFGDRKADDFFTVPARDAAE